MPKSRFTFKSFEAAQEREIRLINSAEYLSTIVAKFQNESPRNESVINEFYNQLRRIVEELETVRSEVNELFDEKGSASGKTVVKDPHNRLRTLDKNLAVYEGIFNLLDQRVEQVTADMLTLQTVGEDSEYARDKRDAYTVFRARVHTFINTILKQRERTLREQFDTVLAVRSRLSEESRDLAEKALFAIATHARTSELDPLMFDRLRGVIGTEERLRGELVQLDNPKLFNRFMASNPSEEQFMRRVFLPRVADWNTDLYNNLLEFCTRRSFYKCVEKLMASDPPRIEIINAIGSVNNIRILELLLSTGIVLNGEETSKVLQGLLGQVYDSDEPKNLECFLQIVSRFGNSMTLEQINNTMRGSLVKPEDAEYFGWRMFQKYLRRESYNQPKMKTILIKIFSLFALPQVQADVTQFYLGRSIFYDIRDPEQDEQLWSQLVQSYFVGTAQQIRENKGESSLFAHDIDFVIQPQLPAPTADEIRAYMRYLAAIFEIDL